MGIKIKKPPFLKIEKAYRLCTAISFYAVFAVILSAVVVVPIFKSASWVLIFYSLSFYLYCASILGCVCLGAISCFKTQNEILGLQTILHAVDLILVGLNYKLFTALFLFGLKLDETASKFVGSDTDAFVEKITAQWGNLIVGILIACVLAIMSTVKLKSERDN